MKVGVDMTTVVERNYVELSERSDLEARRIDSARPIRLRALQRRQEALCRRLPALQSAYGSTGDRGELTAAEAELIGLRDRVADLETGSGVLHDARLRVVGSLDSDPAALARLDALLMRRSVHWGSIEGAERDMAMAAPGCLTGLQPHQVERLLKRGEEARARLDGLREKAAADGVALRRRLLQLGGDGPARELSGLLAQTSNGPLAWPIQALLGPRAARVAFLIDEAEYPDEDLT
jgi:hypothetical protein